MAFVDEMPTRQLAVPDEDGEWFEVRLLSWKELDECRREQSRKFMGRVREMGPDLLKTVADMESGTDPEQATAVAEARAANQRDEALDAFDREMLVSKSVTGWSYEAHFQASRLGKLDEATFTWLFEAIAAMYVGDDAQRKAVSESSSITSTETDLAQTPTT